MLPRSLVSVLAAGVALGALLVPTLTVSLLGSGPAWAQDDDDDDDDDDGDDDDEDGFGSDDDDRDDDNWTPAPTVRRPAPAPAPAPPPVVVNLPRQADDQVVVEGLAAEARDGLIAAGFVVLAEARDRVLLEIPGGLDVDAALSEISAVAPEALVAPNSFYRSQAVPSECAGDMCDHWAAVDWPPAAAMCAFEPHIGVVDTGVNLEHSMLIGARITLDVIGATGAEPSEQKHGTAVAAMFVGNGGGRVPGLVPAAQLLVVDPFGRVGGDERSDVFALVEALDRLGAAGVDIASLSLAGPDNPILLAAVERLLAAGIPIVAAVGNDGPRATPLYPAAYPGVVGVTAIDRRQRIYRRALQGEQVDFAAPGVEIGTAASISGVRPQTGTSFAVPFVTTALLAAMAGGTTLDEAIATLAAASLELGETGRDPVFGWGLVQIPSPC